MCHVLVIEDEWLIAELIADVARDAGATSVDQAETEADAIEAARRHLPAIILSDVNLRVGTGPAAVVAIMAASGPVPVIFITATPEACVPCEPPAVIMDKPVSIAGLTAAFRQLAPV